MYSDIHISCSFESLPGAALSVCRPTFLCIIVFIKIFNHIILLIVTLFGKVESGFESLRSHEHLFQDTTLFCITESKNTPSVVWEYVDLSGVRTDITVNSSLNVDRGLSTLRVYTDRLGNYSCSVSRDNGAVSREYFVVMVDGMFVYFYAFYTQARRKHFSFGRAQS